MREHVEVLKRFRSTLLKRSDKLLKARIIVAAILSNEFNDVTVLDLRRMIEEVVGEEYPMVGSEDLLIEEDED